MPKDDPRIEAYGTVDELNAVLGLARAFNARSGGPADVVARIDDMLRVIQNELFRVGADLSTPADASFEGIVRLEAGTVTRLEQWCDEINADVGPLKEFVLPGGGHVGASLHQARTVCRRAERELAHLMRVDPTVGGACLVYLNRLSDLLFLLARWAGKHNGEPEVLWER